MYLRNKLYKAFVFQFSDVEWNVFFSIFIPIALLCIALGTAFWLTIIGLLVVTAIAGICIIGLFWLGAKS